MRIGRTVGSVSEESTSPTELGRRHGTRCSGSGSSGRSCCDWKPGSSCRCLSSCRREEPARRRVTVHPTSEYVHVRYFQAFAHRIESNCRQRNQAFSPVPVNRRYPFVYLHYRQYDFPSNFFTSIEENRRLQAFHFGSMVFHSVTLRFAPRHSIAHPRPPFHASCPDLFP